ncbi:MAG TPA: cytidylate kinase family protein, partial [Syntrophales bacterium]|nr:cytidylate kinase family protein [Syntrophales bacterium]
RVFVHAPLEFRVQRIMKVQCLSDIKEARALIEEMDRRRMKFIRDIVGTDWTDARNYHLCIDASVIDFNSAVSIIAGIVQRTAKENGP